MRKAKNKQKAHFCPLKLFFVLPFYIRRTLHHPRKVTDWTHEKATESWRLSENWPIWRHFVLRIVELKRRFCRFLEVDAPGYS